ncbi:MAG: NTP transferase domain-containing protein [Myxococcales bacterium]|nr:NTP transferase domain-containing protein [Myxococcales bacterium]
MERAIILAAGLGQRLVQGRAYPKPLQTVNGLPLITRVLRSLERSGVEEAVIVVGHLGDTIVEALSDHFFELNIRFVRNDEYHKPNGTSLLKARDFVQGPTYLLMSDHLWSRELIEAVRRYPLADDEAVLGIDFKVDSCFDLDDATKVAIDGDRVQSIGKQLPRYDALDTGVFRITEAVIEALDRADGPDGCSLSDGMGELARKGRMRVVDVEDAAWIDVDTPEAHVEAERLLRRYGQRLRAMPAADRVRFVHSAE